MSTIRELYAVETVLRHWLDQPGDTSRAKEALEGGDFGLAVDELLKAVSTRGAQLRTLCMDCGMVIHEGDISHGICPMCLKRRGVEP